MSPFDPGTSGENRGKQKIAKRDSLFEMFEIYAYFGQTNNKIVITQSFILNKI